LVLKGFKANERCRIHEEYVLDILSSAGVTGGKGVFVGWRDRIPTVAEFLTM
jgi:hypothetical protein